MKVFAFILAAVLSFQVSTPVICMTSCDGMTMKCEREETPSECTVQSSCCSSEKKSSCHDSVKEADEKETTGNMQHDQSKDCCTPCCSGPLCFCFFEESTELNLSSQPVLLAGQLPSSNGTPIEGYIADCWQPPEFI